MSVFLSAGGAGAAVGLTQPNRGAEDAASAQPPPQLTG